MANKIERILLALDFLEESVFPLEKARHLAKQFEAEVIMLHVIEDLRDYPFLHLPTTETAVLNCSRRMDEYASILTSMGVTVKHTSVQVGKPVENILDTADRLDVDLILLGATRKALLERILGTTAEQVIRRADAPVWVAHAEDAPLDVRKIVCATDFAPDAANTLNTALRIARSLNLKLEILHVFPRHSALKGQATAESMDAHLDRSASDRDVAVESASMEAYLRDFDLSGIDYSYIIRHGAAAKEIANVVSITQSDLLVMGVVTGADGIRGIGRGTLTTLLRTLPCSIVAVRQK